ncbi:glycosyltransferase family 4 protein [Candidatus Thiodiazotropha sp. CDECU1]|uniref:glycosyltransferase family 4 protein n=1 Tax=Candidatus Thiodiazotropha sp. CDECU1 TaxID=3065865 RepID=UPI00292F802C|nr:glycosyltransferase family 4 protein [Candidatus Thiodiazotropha sp. CDECU1]
MSILVTSEAFGGGIESHINSLSECSFWNRCSFLLLKRDDQSLIYESSEDVSKYYKKKLTKIGLVNKILYVYWLIKEVNKNRENIKIIHVHGTIAFYAIAIICKVFKCNKAIYTLVTLHGGVLHKVGIERYVHFLFIKYFQKEISKFVCVSDYDKSLHHQVGIDLKKCVVIENAINPVFFVEDISASERAVRNDARKVIKILSTLYPTKGVSEFFMLLKRTKCLDPSLHAVEIGGDGPCYSGLLKMVTKSDYLSSLVSFKGHVFNAKEYIESADVMIFPSTAETFCLAIREALCLDKVCVCNNGGWIGESERKRVVLYENSNSESFRRAMNLAMKLVKTTMRDDDGKYRTLQNKNYEMFIAKMEKLYDAI